MVRVSAPGPRVRPRVRVHPGVASWLGSRNVTSSKNIYLRRVFNNLGPKRTGPNIILYTVLNNLGFGVT